MELSQLHTTQVTDSILAIKMDCLAQLLGPPISPESPLPERLLARKSINPMTGTKLTCRLMGEFENAHSPKALLPIVASCKFAISTTKFDAAFENAKQKVASFGQHFVCHRSWQALPPPFRPYAVLRGWIGVLWTHGNLFAR